MQRESCGSRFASSVDATHPVTLAFMPRDNNEKERKEQIQSIQDQQFVSGFSRFSCCALGMNAARVVRFAVRELGRCDTPCHAGLYAKRQQREREKGANPIDTRPAIRLWFLPFLLLCSWYECSASRAVRGSRARSMRHTLSRWPLCQETTTRKGERSKSNRYKTSNSSLVSPVSPAVLLV